MKLSRLSKLIYWDVDDGYSRLPSRGFVLRLHRHTFLETLGSERRIVVLAVVLSQQRMLGTSLVSTCEEPSHEWLEASRSSSLQTKHSLCGHSCV